VRWFYDQWILKRSRSEFHFFLCGAIRWEKFQLSLRLSSPPEWIIKVLQAPVCAHTLKMLGEIVASRQATGC
jgi:hypothetical protein